MKTRNVLVLLAAGIMGSLVACGGGGGGGSSTPAPLPTVSNFQKASVVIGQGDFVSFAANRGGTVVANSLSQPYGRPLLAGNALYVPDYSNNRILGYTTVPNSNGADANFVLGQATFTTNTHGASSTTLSGPETVVTYNGKLLVADYGNSRILIWNTLPMTNQVPADVVVGQPDMITNTSACSSAKLNYPESLTVVNGKLLVADSGNNRVLVWNSIPTTNGAAADQVLGQNDFTHCMYNDDNQDGVHDATPSARTLNYPTDIWSDGTRLVISDDNNNRILFWNNFPSVNFAPANWALGQSDFTHYDFNDDNQDGVADAKPSARTLYYPYFIASNGTQLFVADEDNSRVLVWDSFPTANFTPADRVLGQGDFTHNTYNDDNQDGTNDAHPTARTLHSPAGLALIGNQLIVDDKSNNRDLIFTLQ